MDTIDEPKQDAEKQGCKRSFLSLRLGFVGLVSWAALLAGLGTAGGFCGKWWWALDLLSHFRVQYFLGLLLACCLFAVLKRWKSVIACGLLAAVNFCVILPMYCSPADFSPQSGPVLRVMSLNVLTSNGHADRVLDTISHYQPDIILLQEVDSAWLEKLKQLRSDYSFGLSQGRDDNFGIALFSRRPLEDAKVVTFGQAGVPSVVARLKFDGQDVTVIGTHPVPPMSAAGARYRNEQLDAVAEYLVAVKGPKIVLGDLNSTPWSYFFDKFLADASLRDTARGFGVQPTWPAFKKLFPLLIPIDHCLCSDEFFVKNRVVGEAVGSDHFPLIVDLQMVAAPADPAGVKDSQD